jgi:hypothetical protein
MNTQNRAKVGQIVPHMLFFRGKLRVPASLPKCQLTPNRCKSASNRCQKCQIWHSVRKNYGAMSNEPRFHSVLLPEGAEDQRTAGPGAPDACSSLFPSPFPLDPHCTCHYPPPTNPPRRPIPGSFPQFALAGRRGFCYIRPDFSRNSVRIRVSSARPGRASDELARLPIRNERNLAE